MADVHGIPNPLMLPVNARIIINSQAGAFTVARGGSTTFNGQRDDFNLSGYNLGRLVTTEPILQFGVEAHYYDGADRWAEWNLDYTDTAGVAQSRPFNFQSKRTAVYYTWAWAGDIIAFASSAQGVGGNFALTLNPGIKASGTTPFVSFTPPSNTGGVHPWLKISPFGQSGITASTDHPLFDFDMNTTLTWATGALAASRQFVLRPGTLAFVGASVVTKASTLSITGQPGAGSNCTITEALALYIESGLSRFNGGVNLGTTTDATVTGDLAAGLTGSAFKMKYIQATGILSLTKSDGVVQIQLDPASNLLKTTSGEVGNWPNTASVFFLGNTSVDQSQAGNYAIQQTTAGLTQVNSTSGQPLRLKINNVSAFEVDANLFLVPKVALATGMTTGFINIPGAAGAPSGTPATTTGFPLYWDSTNLKLYCYTGGAWKSSAAFA